MTNDTQATEPTVLEPIDSPTLEPISTDPLEPSMGEPLDPITGQPPANTSNGNLVAVMSNFDYSTHSTTTNNYVTTQTQTSSSTDMLGYAATSLDGQSLDGFSCGVSGGTDDNLIRSSRIYRFDSPRYFRNNGKKSQIDRITNFSAADGDKLELARRIFKGMGAFEFESVDSRKQLKQAARGDADIIYFESKGRLYFNANEDDRGFGNKGGLFAILENQPALSADQFLLA